MKGSIILAFLFSIPPIPGFSQDLRIANLERVAAALAAEPAFNIAYSSFSYALKGDVRVTDWYYQHIQDGEKFGTSQFRVVFRSAEEEGSQVQWLGRARPRSSRI